MERREASTVSLNLCSHTHPELCYEGQYCPGCALAEEILDYKKENSRLEVVIVNLNQCVQELQNEIYCYDVDFVQWSDVKAKLTNESTKGR